MSIPYRLAFAFAVLIAPTWVAAGAGAVDASGTWEGSYTCQGFDGVNFKAGNKNSVLLIAQEAGVFSADLDGGDYVYNGVAIDETAKPTERGNLVMNQCTTDAFPTIDGEGEIVRLAIKVNPDKGTGALKGVSIVEFFDGVPTVVTCKFKFKRVSTTTPKFAGCPTM